MSHEYVRNTPETKKRKRKIGATKERATDDRAERKGSFNKYVTLWGWGVSAVSVTAIVFSH